MRTTRTAASHAGGPPRKRARNAHGAIASASADDASDTEAPGAGAAGGS